MGDIPNSVFDLCMFYCIGSITYHPIYQTDRTFDRIDIGIGENDIIIEHVGPGTVIGVVIGIGIVSQNIGKGFLCLQLQTAFR